VIKSVYKIDLQKNYIELIENDRYKATQIFNEETGKKTKVVGCISSYLLTLNVFDVHKVTGQEPCTEVATARQQFFIEFFFELLYKKIARNCYRG
jgi:hypothetical protein